VKLEGERGQDGGPKRRGRGFQNAEALQGMEEDADGSSFCGRDLIGKTVKLDGVVVDFAPAAQGEVKIEQGRNRKRDTSRPHRPSERSGRRGGSRSFSGHKRRIPSPPLRCSNAKWGGYERKNAIRVLIQKRILNVVPVAVRDEHRAQALASPQKSTVYLQCLETQGA